MKEGYFKIKNMLKKCNMQVIQQQETQRKESISSVGFKHKRPVNNRNETSSMSWPMYRICNCSTSFMCLECHLLQQTHKNKRFKLTNFLHICSFFFFLEVKVYMSEF